MNWWASQWWGSKWWSSDWFAATEAPAAPDAVLYRALEDVQSTIQGLSLAGVSSSNIVIQKLATDRGRTTANGGLPAVLIAPLAEDLPQQPALNDQDDITYNILVVLIAADNQDQAANYDAEMTWRQEMRRAFHCKRLGPLTVESVLTFVAPLAPVDFPTWFSTNLFATAVKVQAWCREPRTQSE